MTRSMRDDPMFRPELSQPNVTQQDVTAVAQRQKARLTVAAYARDADEAKTFLAMLRLDVALSADAFMEMAAGASVMRALYDSYVAAGFSDEQAMRFCLAVLAASMQRPSA